MIKKYFAALSAIALIGVAPYALAASSTDLTVTGLITPASCTPSLSGGGTIEYGKISAKDLNQTSSTPLSEEILQLKVDCEATTPMAFRLIDNNPNSETAWNMGLGKTPANENIGHVNIYFSDPVVDGTPVQMSESEDNGQSWNRITFIVRHSLFAPSNLADPTVTIPSKNYSTNLKITGFINRADSLTLTDEVAINGNATIQVEYL
jgi:type 1 fimbria pilin